MLYNGTTSINIDAINEGLKAYCENYNNSQGQYMNNSYYNQQQYQNQAMNNSYSYDYYNQPQYQQNYYDPVVGCDCYGNPITQSQLAAYQQWCYNNPPIIGVDNNDYPQYQQDTYYQNDPIIYVDETQQQEEEVNPFMQAYENDMNKRMEEEKERQRKESFEKQRQLEHEYQKQWDIKNKSFYNPMLNPVEYFELLRVMRKHTGNPYWEPNESQIYEMNYSVYIEKLYNSEKIKLQMMFDEHNFFDSPLLDEDRSFKLWDANRKKRMYYCKEQMDKLTQQGLNKYTKVLYELYERNLFSNQREYEVVMQMSPEDKANRINLMIHPELEQRAQVGLDHERIINEKNGTAMKRPSFAGKRNYTNEFTNNMNNQMYNPYSIEDKKAHDKAMNLINKSVRKSLGISDEEYSNKIQQLRDFDQRCGEQLQYLKEQQELYNLDRYGSPTTYSREAERAANLAYNLAVAQESTENMSIMEYMKKLKQDAYRYTLMDIKKARNDGLYNKTAYRKAIEDKYYSRSRQVPLDYNKNIEFEQQPFEVSMQMAKTLHELNESGKCEVKMNEGSITGPTIKLNFNNRPISEVIDKAGSPDEYAKRKEEFIINSSKRNNRGR